MDQVLFVDGCRNHSPCSSQTLCANLVGSNPEINCGHSSYAEFPAAVSGQHCHPSQVPRQKSPEGGDSTVSLSLAKHSSCLRATSGSSVVIVDVVILDRGACACGSSYLLVGCRGLATRITFWLCTTMFTLKRFFAMGPSLPRYVPRPCCPRLFVCSTFGVHNSRPTPLTDAGCYFFLLSCFPVLYSFAAGGKSEIALMLIRTNDFQRLIGSQCCISCCRPSDFN